MLIGPGRLHTMMLTTIESGIDHTTELFLRSAATALEGAAPKASYAVVDALAGASALRTVADDVHTRLVARGDREKMLIFPEPQKQELRWIARLLELNGL